MKREKITLEFQAYEIEHIKKALELLADKIDSPIYMGISLSNYTDDGKKAKKFVSQIAFILKSIERQMQPKCRIYGSEISFELFVPEKDLKEKVADIWDNPSKYYDVADKSSEAYYGFTKFLWIDFPNGNTTRLADVAVCNDF